MNILRLLAPPSRLLCALSTMALFGCATLVALQYPTHPQAIPAVQRLTSNDALLVQEARIEIVALGAGAMPELYREMPQASSAAKIRIMEVATKIALPAQMLGVIYERAVQDSDTVVRQSAAFQAARAPQLAETLAPIIRTLLYDRVPDVQAAALTALAGYPQYLSSQELLAFISDKEIVVAATAASIALKRDDPTLTVAADLALPRLISQLQHPQPRTRSAVISALGQYGAAPTVPPLITVLKKDKVAEIRMKAAIALLRINTPDARLAALEALKEFSSSDNAALKAVADQYLKAKE